MMTLHRRRAVRSGATAAVRVADLRADEHGRERRSCAMPRRVTRCFSTTTPCSTWFARAWCSTASSRNRSSAATKRLDLRPAVAFRTRVIYGKKLEAGESAGYDRAYVAKRDTWIATLPVGHADGWPRAAAKGAKVRIGTARCIPSSPRCRQATRSSRSDRSRAVRVGDIATLFDWQEDPGPKMWRRRAARRFTTSRCTLPGISRARVVVNAEPTWRTRDRGLRPAITRYRSARRT